MNPKEIIKRLNAMLESASYNEIDDPLNVGLLIEDINEASLQAKKTSFHIGSRNGYHGIDEYLGSTGTNKDQNQTMVLSCKTKKLALEVTRQLNILANEINRLRGLS